MNYTNKIINGDCSEILKDIPDNTIDLTITSPPYDNLRVYQGYNFPFEQIAIQLYRVIKLGGVIVWVVADATIDGSETGTSFKQALFFKEVGFNIHDTMIYNKSGISMPSQNRYPQAFEYMFVFSKGPPKTVNIIKDRKNRWGGHKTFGSPSQRTKEGKLLKKDQREIPEWGSRFNIWEIEQGKGKSTEDEIAYNHPAIFPEQLARDHIISWSNEGDLILDPMCGSGTTCKMAKEMKRNFIGIEISKEYCEIAEKRLDIFESLF